MHVPRYRSDDDRRIVRQAEVLGALSLRPDGRLLHFDFIAAGSQPRHVAGTIDDSGGITPEHDDATTFPPRGGCPICLAATDRIATPRGQLLVTDLHRGALVWTLDASGRRVAAPVLRVGSVAAPPGHQVVRLRLADGRSVDASPGHPTANGRHGPTGTYWAEGVRLGSTMRG